jgi:hypothetical protein
MESILGRRGISAVLARAYANIYRSIEDEYQKGPYEGVLELQIKVGKINS